MADGKSIWKKEISLGRKPPAAEPDEPREETPIWKREISLSRKRKDGAPAGPAAADAVPFWKKELSLGRKKGAEPEPEPELAAPAVPWWKKEVGLGGGKGRKERRRKDEEVERLAEQAAAAVAAPPEEPHETAQPSLPAHDEVPAAPAPPEPVDVAPPPAADPPPPAAELPPGAEVIFTAPPREPVSEPAPEVEVVYAAPPPAPAAEEQTVELPAPAAPPAAQPAPEPAPQQVVHPPVPASELPPLPREARTPWWKKELGAKKRSTLLPEDDEAPRTPWWKKELGGGRKPKAAAEPAAAEPKTPWWKKELGGGRKPKAAAEPAAAEPKTPWWKKELGGKKKAPKPAVPAIAAPAAKTPFWKKDLSLARKPKQADAPKAAKRGGSFLKLDLGSLSLPGLASGRSKRNQKLKKVVGLKVGGSQIAAARVVNNGHAELLQLARQPLEQGIVVGGEVRDPEALAEQLKAFFARHKLPRRNVRLGIASNRIGVRIFDVAGIVDDKALTNAIQFRAQEALPIPLDEAVLDYQVLGETVDAEGQPVKRILLVVAYRELVDRYVGACRKAGISLVGIDLEAFALLRALAAPRPETTEATAATVAVAVGHDRSTFAVTDGRVCEFTRVLEWGGAAVSIGLARALDLAPSEVETIKRSLSLDGSAVPDGLTAEQYATAVDAVRKQIQSFARELVSSLQFYQNQPGSLGIGEIVLSGGSAHLPGLGEELQRLIGVSVRVGDPLARVKVAKKVGSPEQVGSLAVAIGLGIED